MAARQEDLLQLQSYIEGVDKELTMILQSLQWERKHLIESGPMLSCSYDINHRIPPDKEAHEKECFLKIHGYSKEDKMLPDPFDSNANTLVKLSKGNIKQIINNASQADPSFKKDGFLQLMQGVGCVGPEPLTAERLQATYTADERRAIHDAVVCAVPACHDLTELMLLSTSGEGESSRKKSRLEVLAELRNMRRRRTRYRRAVPSRNYSHTLRDLISTQMEMYTEAKNEVAKETLQNNIKSENINKMPPPADFYNNRQRSSEYRDKIKHEDYPREAHEEENSFINRRKYDSYKEKHSHGDKRRHDDDQENKSGSKYFLDERKDSDRKRARHERDKYSTDRIKHTEDYKSQRDKVTYNDGKKTDKNVQRDERQKYSNAEGRSRHSEAYANEMERDTLKLKHKERHTGDYWHRSERHKYPKTEDPHQHNEGYYKSERYRNDTESKSRQNYYENKNETHRTETYRDGSSSSNSKRQRDSEMCNYSERANGHKRKDYSHDK